MVNKRAAVLGSPIEHSRSPVIHSAGYQALGLDDWAYDRFEVSDAELAGFLSTIGTEYRGFSVTMPAKFAALEVATTATKRARAIGAANTLLRLDQRGWAADNTDCEGVTGALSELRLPAGSLNHAVIIGAGGTARPALWALADAGVSTVTVVNRSDRREEMAPLAQQRGIDLRFEPFTADLRAISVAADVIVSTVPASALKGYETDLAHAPIVDVIYDPWPTPLTIAAAANGYPVVGGHVMLAYQAYSQFEQFTGHKAPREAMRLTLKESLGMTDN